MHPHSLSRHEQFASKSCSPMHSKAGRQAYEFKGWYRCFRVSFMLEERIIGCTHPLFGFMQQLRRDMKLGLMLLRSNTVHDPR